MRCNKMSNLKKRIYIIPKRYKKNEGIKTSYKTLMIQLTLAGNES